MMDISELKHQLKTFIQAAIAHNIAPVFDEHNVVKTSTISDTPAMRLAIVDAARNISLHHGEREPRRLTNILLALLREVQQEENQDVGIDLEDGIGHAAPEFWFACSDYEHRFFVAVLTADQSWIYPHNNNQPSVYV